jgi:hypothetical protein
MGETLEDRLRAVISRGPKLRLAILFGSRARGSARPDSDVDLGILPAAKLSAQQENDLAVELERAAGAPVDLVVLDQARPALRWRIARDGVVLWSAPPSEASRFLARTGIEHDEFRELEIDAMRRFRARVAGEAQRRR